MSDLSSDAGHEREQARLLDNFALEDLPSDLSRSSSDAHMSSAATFSSDDALNLGQQDRRYDSDAPQEDRDTVQSASSSHDFDAGLANQGFAIDNASEPSTSGAHHIL